MKYLQIHIKAESGDDIGEFLTKIAEQLTMKGIEYDLIYKDSIVEEMVKEFIADHMSHKEYFATEDDNKL